VDAGTASLQFNDGVAGKQGWAPKLMLGLVGYVCHKELFLLLDLIEGKRIAK